MAQKNVSKGTAGRVLSRAAAGGNTLLSILAGLMAAMMILYSGFVLYDTFYLEVSAASNTFNIAQYKPEIIEDTDTPLSGEQALAMINADYCAWLIMYGSSIDYPVMQGTDDLYYASHNIYHESSLTGSIYMAAGNSAEFTDTYNVIYGHHMDNGAMFGSLDNYMTESFYNANREGLLIGASGLYDLTTFAVVTTNAYESQIYIAGNRIDEVRSFLEEHLETSDDTTVLYMDEEILSNATQIAALSTCMSAETSGRLVVFVAMTLRNPVAEDTEEPETGLIEMSEEETPIMENEQSVSQMGNAGEPSVAEAELDEIAIIEETETPLAHIVEKFDPKPTLGKPAWALVNLICLIITVYLFVPLLHLNDKYGRGKAMKKFNKEKMELTEKAELNETEQIEKQLILETAEKNGESLQETVEKLYYHVGQFVKKFRIGFVLEVVSAAAAIVLFVMTQDMSLPMILIDKWTPFMLVLMLLMGILDICLMRYRNKLEAEELVR